MSTLWSAVRQPARRFRVVGTALVALCVGAAVYSNNTQTPLPAPLDRPAVTLSNPSRAAMLGLSSAGTRVVAVGERGTVLLSDDAGSTWRQAQRVPVSTTLVAVQFVNQKTGWAVGHYGVVLRSDDGGESWSRQLDGHAAAALMLQEAKASGDARALVEAERAVAEGADKPLLSLHFRNENEGWVVGAFNLALTTRDGGQSWQSVSSRLPNPKAGHLYSFDQDKSDVLIAGEQGLVMHSSDGVLNFRVVPTPYAGSFFGVTREADGAWLVAGLRGNVWRSADQGKSWTALTGQAPVSVTGMLRDSQGQVWLANQAGQLLQAKPGAIELGLVSSTAAQQPASLLKQADGSLLLAGWNGITRVSQDQATTAR